MVNIDPETGGPARSVPGLIKAISSCPGFEAELYLRHLPRVHTPLESSIKIGKISGLSRLVRQQKREQETGIILHNQGVWHPTNHYASSIAKRHRIPTIISTRGMLEPWARNHHKLKKTIAWLIYQRRDLKRASLLHATSSMEAENIKKYDLKLPIALVPNGVIVPQNPNTVNNDNKENHIALFLSRIHPKRDKPS